MNAHIPATTTNSPRHIEYTFSATYLETRSLHAPTYTNRARSLDLALFQQNPQLSSTNSIQIDQKYIVQSLGLLDFQKSPLFHPSPQDDQAFQSL